MESKKFFFPVNNKTFICYKTVKTLLFVFHLLAI